MGFWRIVFTIILPPLGVLLGKGFGWAFILNIILTLLGYIPGLIHAFWVRPAIKSWPRKPDFPPGPAQGGIRLSLYSSLLSFDQ